MNRENNVDLVAEWEAGRRATPVPNSAFGNLYEEILALILPRMVFKRKMDSKGRVDLLPPVPHWTQILRSCRDFLSKPVRWEPFAMYTGQISEQLFAIGVTRLLNERFAERFTHFTAEELDRLLLVLEKIVSARGSQMPKALEKEESALLQRAIDVAGELEVSGDRAWRLDTFTKKGS